MYSSMAANIIVLRSFSQLHNRRLLHMKKPVRMCLRKADQNKLNHRIAPFNLILENMERNKASDELIFQENILVKSFEIGNDNKMSIVALANHLQEIEVNHSVSVGFNVGFASTTVMAKLGLIWATSKMHIHVDRYPSLGDVVQVSNWMYESGRIGIRSDSIISNIKTGEIFARGSRIILMMNKNTKKVSRITEEVKEKMRPHLVLNCSPIVEDCTKFSEADINMTEYMPSYIKPGWNDLDINQHVNNVKYIDWFMESTPRPILKTHELSSITLEYRNECLGDVLLQSFTKEIKSTSDHHQVGDIGVIEFRHSIRLDHGGPEVVRGRTIWKPRQKNN